jgi:hypothetical protein
MVLTGEEKKAFNRAYYQANKEKNKCEHNKFKSSCKECGGSSFCEHGRQKSKCKECGGSSCCEHGRQKSRCKECGGSEICEHNRRKSRCKECGGSEICEHNRIKSRCKECGGSEICEHNRRKARCKECGGSDFCEHNRRKSQCKECGGSAICEHNQFKSRCKACGGSSICEHNREKSKCKECLSLGAYLVKLQRGQLRRVLNLCDFNKSKSSIEYLGCSVEYFIEFMKTKMTDGMTFDNIHLDHIKPVSRYNLENEDEFLDCVHYTNFQPLIATDNLSKNNKWSEVDEIFWTENIKGKEYHKIYMPI